LRKGDAMHARPTHLHRLAWLLAVATAALVAGDLPADPAARAGLPLHAAGVVAWLVHRAHAPRGTEHSARMLAGLLLGAALAHLGWALLHAPSVVAKPLALLDARAGYSLLFVPAGVLLAAPRAADGARFRADALASLPLAFATARIACLEAGCCHGRWSAALQAPVPTAAFEAVACTALALGHARPRVAAHPARGAVALLGLGAVRLAAEPWRADPPLGAPWLPPAVVAGVWVALGAVLAWRTWPPSGLRSGTSSRGGGLAGQAAPGSEARA
jgi:hypothetical protein